MMTLMDNMVVIIQDVFISYYGNTVADGSPYNNVNGINSGHVRVYAHIENSWVKVGNYIDIEYSNDYLGASISISSDVNTVSFVPLSMMEILVTMGTSGYMPILVILG